MMTPGSKFFLGLAAFAFVLAAVTAGRAVPTRSAWTPSSV